MTLSNVAIRRPVFISMVTIALMFLGYMGARSLGVDLWPAVDFPLVTIVTVYPGAGPEEVEQLVSKPVEEALSSINGIEEVHSTSRDSVSQVMLLFKLEVDAKAAANDVRDKMAAIRGKLPKEIKDPVIQRMDPSAIAVMTYAVSSGRGSAETRRITEDVIKPKLESIDGVASVAVVGGLEREVHVYVDRARLEALGLSLAQIAQQLGSESFDLPGGRITAGESELNVRTLGRFRSLEELSNMVVASLPNGSQVKLGEVARIDDGYKEMRTIPLLDGQEAVTFDIQKAAGTNTVKIADAVYQRLDELKKTLPADVTLKKVVDLSTFIRFNIDDVTESIVWGGLMAVLVIFFFMLDWRSTLISSLALPTSVVTTFLAMWWMGFTFNMISMMGLSLAIGLLIDDAVVVRENIYRHMEMGEDPVTAAQRGTDQIGLAVMATTFTIVAVFVPVAFMGGMIGKMLKQFGLTVAAAVIVSLFISFTLDPMLSARVVKAIEPGRHEKLKKHKIYGPIVRMFEAMDEYYRGLLTWALGHKKTVAGGVTLIFVGSLALIPLMGNEFVAAADRGEFRVALEAPAGTSVAQMRRIAEQAEALVRKSDQVKAIYTVIGPGEESNKANLRVYTTKRNERPEGKKLMTDIQQEVRQHLASLPSVVSLLTDVPMMESAGMDRPVTLFVRGENYETLQQLGKQALEIVRNTRGTTDPDLSYRPGKPETSIHVDRSRAADLGVSLGTVASTVRLALEGDVVAKYRQGDRDWDVRLQLSPQDRSNALTLSELTVPATGRRLGAMPGAPRLVRVGEIAAIEGSTGPATIQRQNRQRQVIVTANLAKRSLGEVVSEVEGKLAKLDVPAGYRFEFGGQTKNMRETASNMGLALLVAVIFIYFVLASQFESFVHPFTIMMALPLALVGAVVGLFVSGYSFSMMAMIGIILLMGLVTKNSILLVDYTNELRAEGMGMIDALLKAGATRLRPILMTSAAMVLGMVPTATSRGEGSEMRVPMAIAVIGGVLASTFLTLLVVPVVYTWMDRFTLKKKSSATVDVSHKGESARIAPVHPAPEAVPAGADATGPEEVAT